MAVEPKRPPWRGYVSRRDKTSSLKQLLVAACRQVVSTEQRTCDGLGVRSHFHWRRYFQDAGQGISPTQDRIMETMSYWMGLPSASMTRMKMRTAWSMRWLGSMWPSANVACCSPHDFWRSMHDWDGSSACSNLVSQRMNDLSGLLAGLTP